MQDELISRQAVLEMAYDVSEIDGEHFTEPCMVVDVEDIQNLSPVTPQPKHEDIAKAFQFGLALGFGEKHNEMDKVIDEIKKVITPQPKIGRWIFVDKAHEHAHCSECDYGDVDLMDGRPHNYCPNCGAKMLEVKE